MSADEYLNGKRILAVDDEDDVLDLIQEQLRTCVFTSAGDFESARKILDEQQFDLVILDVMGVRGFDLLDITRDKQIPTVMLTAHALTPDGFQRSIDAGAVSFLPKEEICNLSLRLTEILIEVEKGQTHWPKLIHSLGPKFRQIWGNMWQKVKLPKDNKLKW